jgi:HEAT repeat protein
MEDAVSILRSLVNDDEAEIRATLARALASACGPDAIDALIQMLSDESGLVRANAARELGKMGIAAEFVLSDLQALLDDDSPENVRKAALAAISMIEGDDEYADLLEEVECDL